MILKDFKDSIGIFENALTKKQCEDMILLHNTATDRVYEGNYGMGSTDYADGYFDPNFYYFENMNYYDSEQTNRGPFMKLNMYSKYVSGN